MANFLYMLGRFVFRNRWKVVGVWITIVLIIAGLMSHFKGTLSNTFSIPGTESQAALDALSQKFPEASGGQARIVFVAPTGSSVADPDSMSAIRATLAKVSKESEVLGATDPFYTKAISADGSSAFSQIQLSVSGDVLSDDARSAILADLEIARSAGLQTEANGDIIARTPNVGSTEGIGLIVAAIVLMATFGSVVAAGLPLLTAITGVGVGVMSMFALSGHFQMSSTAPILALMLGLAVGIDYSLLIISRYRKFLTEGLAVEDAAARATGTAGTAVVFAGLTVVIALSALSVVNIPFLSVMGLGAAGTVAVAVLVAVTLVPAFLGFIGKNALSKKQQAELASRHISHESDAMKEKGFGFRWARMVTGRPALFIIAGIVIIGALAYPVRNLKTGLPGDKEAAPETTQHKAYDLITEKFGPGFNGPLLIVADLPAGSNQSTGMETLGMLAAKLDATEGVLYAIPAQVNADATTGILQVIPKTRPEDSATNDLIARIRDNRDEIAAGTNATITVTGVTALTIDVTHRLSDALPVYLLIVVGISLILLLMVFRSILVPIKATLGFLLSIAASFGATVSVFQLGHFASLFGVKQPANIVSFLPILLTGILFGLAMDYEVFLVSGVRESYIHHKKGPRYAVVDGVGHNARVVTAAAAIMVSVFAAFMLGDDPIIKSIGFSLAVGVFVDAFIVRLTVVPAVMALLGDASWWMPKWLAKIVPNVDIEGDSIKN
jgi:putative drug exporter of the RND superfamily